MQPIPSPLTLKRVIIHRQKKVRPTYHTVIPYEEWVEVVIEGHGWVCDGPGGTERREVGPGDLLWHSPGHWTICCDNPFTTFCVQFTVSRAEGMGIRRFSKWLDIGAVKALAQETCGFQWDETFDRNVLRDHLYSKLLFQVRLYERSLEMASYPEAVARVLRRIENDFARPLPLRELARDSGWSDAYLQTQFARHLKTTPHQMLIQQRLQAAKERLATTAEPIKKIAVECGFSTQNAFGHAFKKHTGQTPSEFRRGYRNST